MNDRPRDDEPSASDWLAAQFRAEEEETAPPAPPAAPPPPAAFPAAPDAVPPAAVPPAAPPSAFVSPTFTQPPAPQQPSFTQPPAPQQPAMQVPPAAPTPAAPQEPAAGGFAWGLRPGGASTPPVPPQPAGESTPATAPPVAPTVPPLAAPSADPFGAVAPAAVPPSTAPAQATPPPATTPPAAALPPAFPPTASMPPAQTPPPAPTTPPASSAPPVPPPLVEPAAPAPTVAWTPPPLEFALDGVAAPAEPPAEPMPFETARLPEVAPDSEDAPSWDIPTQMMAAVPPPQQAPAPLPTEPFAASEFAATEVLGAPEGAAAPVEEGNSALDALFAAENFRDYEAEPVASESPFVRSRGTEAAPADEGPREISRTQKVLLGVAGGLVAVLALVALFLLGTRLPELIGPAAAPEPSSSPSPSPSPSATALPAGPVEPGVWAWGELLGGECLDPYDDPWAEEFTVVDCADPHPAQLVYRGTFPPSAEGVTSDPFPGTAELQRQIGLLCSAPGVVDLTAAGALTDVQFQGSYPATQEQWDAGDRSYFCFVSRSSGEPLTGTLAVPPPPPAEGDGEATEG